MLITDEYRQLNSDLHKDKPTYGRSGQKWKDAVIALCEAYMTLDVLDYGCGKSTLQGSLPFEISQYDPCITELSEEPDPADILVCTDVLEHIEPELLEAVLDDLKAKMLKAGLITIATRKAHKTLSDGRNAHLTVEQWDWWKPLIEKRFNVLGVEFDLTEDGEVVVLLEAKNE